jgi:hypothetical protein
MFLSRDGGAAGRCLSTPVRTRTAAADLVPLLLPAADVTIQTNKTTACLIASSCYDDEGHHVCARASLIINAPGAQRQFDARGRR